MAAPRTHTHTDANTRPGPSTQGLHAARSVQSGCCAAGAWRGPASGGAGAGAGAGQRALYLNAKGRAAAGHPARIKRGCGARGTPGIVACCVLLGQGHGPAVACAVLRFVVDGVGALLRGGRCAGRWSARRRRRGQTRLSSGCAGLASVVERRVAPEGLKVQRRRKMLS